MRVAATRIPVLITGESGTGKELLADLIHRLGPTPDGPFVTVNCGTLPRELAESELFGHERGAFTGAGRQKAGWFEEADGGTLVLDEIGEMPIDLQPKLLRVLETGRLRRVGGTGEVSVRVRIAALTLRDLWREVGRGTFRNDLYHRLAGFELTLPPLRHRRADIPLLVEHFLAELSSELGPRVLDQEAARRLLTHAWPGNVRELRNVLRRAAVLCPHQITADVLELYRKTYVAPTGSGGSSWGASPEPGHLAEVDEPDAAGLHAPSRAVVPAAMSPDPSDRRRDDLLALEGRTFEQIERDVFGWALGQNGGSRRRAARALGLPKSSFCEKVKRHGLV
jgi:DNA-binding NtrC family response regulator